MELDEILGYVKSYVRKTLEGEGAIKGVPCEIDNILDTADVLKVTFKWQDKEGTVHHQEMDVPKPKNEVYSTDDQIVGSWIDGEPIYRKVIEITDTSLIQKGNAFTVCNNPDNFKMLVKGFGIIKTYEGSYSNSDILVFSTNTEIKARQNFTGYPEKMFVIIEYIKQ